MQDDILTVQKAINLRSKHGGYIYGEPIWHEVAHIMAALAEPDHVMDFEYAKKNLPASRINGIEVEPIALVYQIFLEYYSKPFDKALQKTCNSMSKEKNLAHWVYNNDARSAAQIAIDFIKALLQHYADKDLEKIDQLKNIEKQIPYNEDTKFYINQLKKTPEHLLIANKAGLDDTHSSVYSPKETLHLKNRLEYWKNLDSVQWPSVEEIEYHIQKAEQFCKNFKVRHGKYPSQLEFKEIEKMPIDNFAISHADMPEEIKAQWGEQKALWQNIIANGQDNSSLHTK